MNPAACAFYGYAPDELVGKSIRDIELALPDGSVQTSSKVIEGHSQPLYTRHRLASGEVRDVEVYSSEVGVAGGVRGVGPPGSHRGVERLHCLVGQGPFLGPVPGDRHAEGEPAGGVVEPARVLGPELDPFPRGLGRLAACRPSRRVTTPWSPVPCSRSRRPACLPSRRWIM